MQVDRNVAREYVYSYTYDARLIWTIGRMKKKGAKAALDYMGNLQVET